MRYEILHNLHLPKIGFGTWRIGGDYQADRSSDAWSIQVLRSALEAGYTHFDTAERYAAGHAEELLGTAIRDVHFPREKLFITSKVDPMNLAYDNLLQSCADSLRRLGMDYLDLYLIHWPNTAIPLSETFRALNKLQLEGKVQHVGVSNFELRLLKQAVELCETPLLTDQVPYNLADRTYAHNGVLEFCQNNDILLTAYSPIKRINFMGNRALLDVAEAHGSSPQQIALAWLTTQPRVITIPLAREPQHQIENLQAGDLLLSEDEMAKLARSG